MNRIDGKGSVCLVPVDECEGSSEGGTGEKAPGEIEVSVGHDCGRLGYFGCVDIFRKWVATAC